MAMGDNRETDKERRKKFRRQGVRTRSYDEDETEVQARSWPGSSNAGRT